MEPLFKLVGEICDSEEKVDPLFLFFVTNLIHELTREDADVFSGFRKESIAEEMSYINCSLLLSLSLFNNVGIILFHLFILYL